MGRAGLKGSITVFLSITSIFFLSLICAAVESARIQGAKAQTANIMGMGNFSLLGEYENALLDGYQIFALNGAYGQGSFQIQKVNERLEGFLSDNANPKKDFLSGLCFDPWNLSLTGSGVEAYTLLTDENGEPFYQQAVAYMKANLGAMAIDQLLDYAQDAEEVKKWQEQYEASQKENDAQMSGLEDQKQERLESLDGSGTGETAVTVVGPENNPLDEIAKLRKKSILQIVTWNQSLSGKKMKLTGLPSRGWVQKGNLAVVKEHSGLIANVLFREYLLMHFPNYVSGDSGKALDYQVEYILGGKATDEGNLSYVAKRLLLIREGMNYLFCAQHPQMGSQAGTLAISLTGFLGIPALTTATKHALLLAWAYGESLIDVRILLDGGRVPLYKSDQTWELSLENLGRITEILSQGAKKESEGSSYRDYLRILLNLGSLKKQKVRALDLIQTELQGEAETSEFEAEDCIVAVKTYSSWTCPPVFFSLPQVVMGISGQSVMIKQQGSMAY